MCPLRIVASQIWRGLDLYMCEVLEQFSLLTLLFLGQLRFHLRTIIQSLQLTQLSIELTKTRFEMYFETYYCL